MPSDSLEDILNDLTRITAMCDQLQKDIDTTRERFKDAEYIQLELDKAQLRVDIQMSELKIAKARVRRNMNRNKNT